MRVLHVIARLNVGGTARYLETLSLGLTAARIENAIATGFVQDGEIEDECVARLPILRVKHLGRAISPLNDLQARHELKKVIYDFKPDIIHTHTFKAGVLSRSIRHSSRRVHTYHGHILNDGSLSSWQTQLVLAAERHYAKKTDRLISVGQKVSTELKELGIGRYASWESIAPGIEPPALPDRHTAAKSLEIDPTIKTVSWLGRMVRVKDPEMMVEIAKLLPQVQFLMAGGGDLLEKIRGVAPGNVVIPGWVPRENVLACSDIIVMTSVSEGMPLAAIEAQFAGIPVIAPSVGSLPEVVADNESGLIVERKVSSFVQAISNLLSNDAQIELLINGARLRANSRFTVNRMVEQHTKIYHDVLSSAQRRFNK